MCFQLAARKKEIDDLEQPTLQVEKSNPLLIGVEESYNPLSTLTYFGIARTLQYRSLKMHAYLGDWIHSTVHCKLLAADKECEWSTKEEEAHFSRSARLQTEIVSHRFKPLPQLTNYRAMFLFFHCRFAFGRPLLEYKVPFVWTFPGKRKNPSWPAGPGE